MNIKNLLKKLSDKDAGIRSEAAKEIADEADAGEDVSEMLPEIIKSLKDKEAYVRHMAVFTLTNLHKNFFDIEDAFEALIEVLNDENAGVKTGALLLLTTLHRDLDLDLSDARKTFIRLLKDKEGAIRRSTVLALNTMSDPETEKGLVSALTDEDPLVKRYASGGLVKIYLKNKKDKDVEKLITDKDVFVREGAMFILEAYDVEGILFKVAFPFLIQGLSDKGENVRLHAVQGIAKASKTENVFDSMNVLVSLLNDVKMDTKVLASFALAMIAKKSDTTSILPELMNILKDVNQENDVRVNVARIFKWNAEAGRDISKYISELIEYLDDPSEDVYYAVTNAIASEYLNEGAWGKISAFMKDKNPIIREGICGSVGASCIRQIDFAPIVPDLIQVLKERNDASQNAMYSLCQFIEWKKENPKLVLNTITKLSMDINNDFVKRVMLACKERM